MKKFAGTKRLDILRAQAKAYHVEIDERAFKRGADMVYFKSPGVQIALNTFNGRFYGVNATASVTFSSDSSKHDKEPWFQTLLEFFYTNDKTLVGSVGAL
jgi:hypothetical protein